MMSNCLSCTHRTILLLTMLTLGNSVQAGLFPYRYTVPEGSIGLFRNQGTFYNEVYPAGTYNAWPKDEGFTISLEPVVKQVKKVPCTTVEGFSLSIPSVLITYRTTSESVLPLVLNHGLRYEEALVRKPVIEEVDSLCGQTTVESVYLAGLSTLGQQLKERMEKIQLDQSSGLLIESIELSLPDIPDDVLQDYLAPQISSACQEPYDIFYALEDESDARSRLCGRSVYDEVTAVPQTEEQPEEDFIVDQKVIEFLPDDIEVTFEEPSLEGILPGLQIDVALEESEKIETIAEVLPLEEMTGHEVSQLIPEIEIPDQMEQMMQQINVIESVKVDSEALSKSQKKQKIWKNKNGQLYLSW